MSFPCTGRVTPVTCGGSAACRGLSSMPRRCRFFHASRQRRDASHYRARFPDGDAGTSELKPHALIGGDGTRSAVPEPALLAARCDGPGRARLPVTRAFRRPVTACPSRGRPASERGCRAERLPEVSLCIWALAHTVSDKADRFLLGLLVGLKRHHPLPQRSLAQRSSLTKSPPTKPPALYFLSWHSEFLCIALTAKRLITY